MSRRIVKKLPNGLCASAAPERRFSEWPPRLQRVRMSALPVAPMVSQIRSVAVSVALPTRFPPAHSSSDHSMISQPAPRAIPSITAVRKKPNF
jgi:hypothetical protein